MSKPSGATDPKSWATQLIELYRQGCGDAEVAAEMQITIKEYHAQIGESATFAKLVEFGRTLYLAYWEKQARLNINNKQFNTPLWAFYMKNKFGWADKMDTTSQQDVALDLDTLREKVSKQAAKYIKDNTPELTDAQRVLSGIGASIMMEGSNEPIQPV